MNHRINFIFIGMIILVILFGVAEVLKDYHLSTITGSAISGEFEIESIKEAVNPTTAVLLRMEDQKLKKEVLELIKEKDDLSLILEKTQLPVSEEDDYLFLEWDYKLNLISLYMKKNTDLEGSFEIWGPSNIKIASGELTEEYKWYHFEVSSTKMSSSSYAIFNSGNGEIILDKVLGISAGENGLAKLTGMMIGRMV